MRLPNPLDLPGAAAESLVLMSLSVRRQYAAAITRASQDHWMDTSVRILLGSISPAGVRLKLEHRGNFVGWHQLRHLEGV